MGNFSKIEAGKFDLEYCAFDLRTVVEFGVIVTCAASGRDALEELVLADRLGRSRSVEEMFGAVPPQLQADRSSGQKKLHGRVLVAKDNLTNQKVM
jgi:hypothetical protein